MDQVEYEKGEIPSSELRVPRSDFRAVVIGGSAGGVEGLTAIFAALPSDFELPVLVVQHLHPSDDGAFARHLARITRLPVVEPCDKERIERGRGSDHRPGPGRRRVSVHAAVRHRPASCG